MKVRNKVQLGVETITSPNVATVVNTLNYETPIRATLPLVKNNKTQAGSRASSQT